MIDYAEAVWLLTTPGPEGTLVLHEEALALPAFWSHCLRVRVAGDLFDERVPDEFIARVWDAMRRATRHVFLIATAHWDRLMRYARTQRAAVEVAHPDTGPDGALPNLWAGAIVHDQTEADSAFLPLLQTPAAGHFMVCVLRGPIILQGLGEWDNPAALDSRSYLRGNDGRQYVRWVVAGGETEGLSGRDARPMHPLWAQALRAQCALTSTPFLFAGYGDWIPKVLYTGEFEPGMQWGALDANGHWFPETSTWNGRQGSAQDGYEYTLIRPGAARTGNKLDGRFWLETPWGPL